MSSTWLTTYTTALSARDTYEKANEPLINAYTALADQNSQAGPATGSISAENSAAKDVTSSIPPPIIARAATSSSLDPSTAAALTQLRADLGVANRARADLASSLSALQSELSAVQANLDSASSSVNVLTRQKAFLERKLRDRDSELVERKKLLERVQDEMVGLEMQMNVAEEEKSRVTTENEELVKRLVKEREMVVAERVRMEERG